MGGELSPEFEQYLQAVERGENPRPPDLPPAPKPTPPAPRRTVRRQRTRKVECVLPDCDHQVRRSNRFPLCTEHLLQVWKLVDGDRNLNGRGFHADGTGEAPNLVTVTTEEQEAQRLAKRQKLREIAATTGGLYVLDTRDGLVKIGWTSRDLWERISQYPPTFRLITQTRGSRADERDLHRSLRLSRVKGREWYEVTPEVVRLINQWIAIENTTQAQRVSNERAAAIARRQQSGIAFPLDQAVIEAVPTFKPKFVSLDKWNVTLRPTGTQPEGHFRAGLGR